MQWHSLARSSGFVAGLSNERMRMCMNVNVEAHEGSSTRRGEGSTVGRGRPLLQ